MIKDDVTGADGWTFNCPIHGWESQVFCFRAFQEDNIDCWFLFNSTIIEPSDEQREAFIKLFRERSVVA